jgi:electron transfer flavoprotein beta subunit
MPGLQIAVCVKFVLDPKDVSEESIDSATGIINRAKYKLVINPLDKHALFAARQLQKVAGGVVTAVSMGPPSIAEDLTEILSLGADHAFLLSDSLFAGADTLATSYTLACGIKKFISNFDLILCGAKSLDGSTAQVGPQLAIHLGVPCVTNVSALSWQQNGFFNLRMKLEDGYLSFTVKPPVLFTVNRNLNTPQPPTLMDIVMARSKKVTVISNQDLGLDLNHVGLAGSPTRFKDMFYPPSKRKRELLSGLPEEMVNTLFQELRTKGIFGQ